MRSRISFLLLLTFILFLGFGLSFTKVESQIFPINSNINTNRPKRSPEQINLPAVIESVSFDKKRVLIPCPKTLYRFEGECFDRDMTVEVTTAAKDPENDVLTYRYEVSGGKIVGESFRAKVIWDLTGVQPGAYTIKVGVDDGCGVCGETVTKTIEVERCNCPHISEPCPACPFINIKSSAEKVKGGDVVIFTAESTGTDAYFFTYEWTVLGGTIIEGQGTTQIKVKANRGKAKAPLTANLKAISNVAPSCPACENYATKTIFVKRR